MDDVHLGVPEFNAEAELGDIDLRRQMKPGAEGLVLLRRVFHEIGDDRADRDPLADEVRAEFAAQEGAAFVSGNGVNKPTGFAHYTSVAEGSQVWGQTGFIETGASGAFPTTDPADPLIDLIYTPKQTYRANGRFVMNRATVGAVRKLKDGDDNYLWRPSAEPGVGATLMGYPVTEAEEMPNIGPDALAIAFGDFARGYLIVDRVGMRVLRDPFSSKPYVLFYTTKRVGGGVQDFEAIKFLKFANS